MWDLANRPDIKHKLDLNITEDLVKKKLRKLKISKSPGPDGIHPRVLKEIGDTIAVPLTIIFNRSLRTGTLPELRDLSTEAI